VQSEQKPLFTLSIGEFMGMIKKLVDEAFSEREQKERQQGEQKKETDVHFSIKQLAEFLSCSKVSIHKYKKKGMPFYRIGRKILFKKQEVLNFMRSLGRKRIIEA
jgi:excisionase family DNA binding protein